MKQLIILFAAILLLSSSGCKVPQAITKTVIEVRDTTIYVKVPVYVDKLIYVPLPKDTVFVTDTVKVVNGYAEMRSIYVQRGIIGVEASIHRSVFDIVAYLTDSTILYNYVDTLTYEDSVRIHNAIKNTVTDNTYVVKERFIPGFYKFTFWVFIVVLIGGIMYVAWMVFFKRLAGKYFKI